MCNTDNLRIDIKALPEGDTAVAQRLGGDFFSNIEGSEITQGDVHVDVSIRKTPYFSEIRFRAVGSVSVICDRCLDVFDQKVDTEHMITVKYGDEYTEDDEYITITNEDSVVDIAWCVYESIVLALPVKHVHAPGKCNPAMINMLKEHSVTRSDDTADSEEIDPRWSALAQLKEKIKN